MLVRTRRLCLMGVLALVLCNGCGKRLRFNDAVEGIAKLDGKPLGSVYVAFIPELEQDVKAPSSSGFTDSEGKYSLKRDDGRPGALVGKHRVVILRGREANRSVGEAPDPSSGGLKDRRPVPATYTMASKTPLMIDVTPDKHTYEVDLKN